jgi:hypothetical protein
VEAANNNNTPVLTFCVLTVNSDTNITALVSSG